MIAEIVAIGTELLMGQIADSDAQMLSRELQSLGIAVYHHQVVGDNPQRMREALALALSRSDLVITTGGLGPTQDDLSKEIAAELLGLPMEFDPESWDAIGQYFVKIGRVCPMNNRKQAMFAKGCTILPNACGTAPGCMIEKDGKIVVQLPGPPHEMADMFGRQVYGRLAAKDGRLHRVAVHPHLRHGRIAGRAGRARRWIENGEGVTVAPYCALGECQLRVTARGRDEDGGAAAGRARGGRYLRRAGRLRLRRDRDERGLHAGSGGARAGGAAADRFDGGELHGRHGRGEPGGLSRHFRMSV